MASITCTITQTFRIICMHFTSYTYSPTHLGSHRLKVPSSNLVMLSLFPIALTPFPLPPICKTSQLQPVSTSTCCLAAHEELCIAPLHVLQKIPPTHDTTWQAHGGPRNSWTQQTSRSDRRPIAMQHTCGNTITTFQATQQWGQQALFVSTKPTRVDSCQNGTQCWCCSSDFTSPKHSRLNSSYDQLVKGCLLDGPWMVHYAMH